MNNDPEKLKELLREVVRTFEPMFHQSDVLKRIREELDIEVPWFAEQHEPKDLTDTIDMSGKKCLKCKKGHYAEISIHDDWEGHLHCVSCGDQTDRYVPKHVKSAKGQ